jgi:TIR domain
MSYKYDVFISYKSKSRDWVNKIFLPLFEHYLEEAVGGKSVNIFFDQIGIEGGDAWEKRLKNALAHSKCMVSILKPSYFNSEWCKKEFAVMEYRSTQYGLCTIEMPGGLIVPISVYDGNIFPDAATAFQISNYEEFYRANIKGFEELKAFQELQTELKTLTLAVAKAIKKAPKWDKEWLEDKWLELPIDHLVNDDTKIPQPKI